ncbi:hypothetical protein BJX63DRAFT_360506 [Aspergillus granulosus]|uniref:Uncharacterized protein n=1 Tax=Aspergillus granulosus TaxID=176169 RepID=A0ABR4HYH2_9EURO
MDACAKVHSLSLYMPSSGLLPTTIVIFYALQTTFLRPSFSHRNSSVNMHSCPGACKKGHHCRGIISSRQRHDWRALPLDNLNCTRQRSYEPKLILAFATNLQARDLRRSGLLSDALEYSMPFYDKSTGFADYKPLACRSYLSDERRPTLPLHKPTRACVLTVGSWIGCI